MTPIRTAFRLLFASAVLGAALPALAGDDAAPPPATTTTLDTVLVTGEQPGPGLWKVSRGDHVLWILGAQYPLPRKMTWRSAEVERTIAQSQAVLADASVKLDIGIFRAMTLLPSALGARKNADGRKLDEILSPELYARWQALKDKYIGRDRGVERLRPMVAAGELYGKALDRSGLVRNGDVWKAVEKIARRARVRVIEPEVKIPVDDPKQALNDFRSTAGALDVACLEATIRRLETDLDAMRQRANAWAVGDIGLLRRLPYPDLREACRAALESNLDLRQHLDAAMTEIDAAWLSAAQKALAENTSTLAVLPMDELLRPDRRLAMLAARGYAVEPPE